MKNKMTLLYKLLGIPGNMRELVEKADKINKIPGVFVKRIRESTLVPGAAPYKYVIGIELGLIKLKMYERRICLEDYVHGIDAPARLSLEDEYIESFARGLADELSTTNGFRVVTINGKFHNLIGTK